MLSVNFEENKTNLENLFDSCYKGEIRINDEIIALTSNSIYKKGKDHLIFVNIKSIKSKEIVKEIIGYSFVQTTNGLKIIPSENPKFLLCAYLSKSKKNGILIINLDILKSNLDVKNEDENYLKFIETETFSVKCLCHIKEQNNKDDENIDLNKSNSFFNNNTNMENKENIIAGGLDEDKQDGIIKLYTIIYNDTLLNVECTCLQDINLPPSSEGYKYAVNNIIQLKGNGKFVIGASQGNFLYKIRN